MTFRVIQRTTELLSSACFVSSVRNVNRSGGGGGGVGGGGGNNAPLPHSGLIQQTTIDDFFFPIFPREQGLTVHANCLHFVKSCFLGKIKIFQYVVC